VQAGRLFAAQGFAATSTRQIAEAAGIRQPTLFHYYPTKLDVLRELSERAWRRPLEVLDEILATDVSPAVRLFRVVHFQTRHLCSNPLDLTAVLQDAHRLDPKRFRRWHDEVRRYTEGVRLVVEQGVGTGEFRPCEPGVQAMGILGMCNWTIRWFKAGGPLSAGDVAGEFARSAVRALLTAPGTLDAVAAEALAVPLPKVPARGGVSKAASN